MQVHGPPQVHTLPVHPLPVHPVPAHGTVPGTTACATGGAVSSGGADGCEPREPRRSARIVSIACFLRL